MLVDSGSAITLLSEWFVMVELGYELDVLLALRQSEDIVGPSGKPLFLYFSFLVFFFFLLLFLASNTRTC